MWIRRGEFQRLKALEKSYSTMREERNKAFGDRQIVIDENDTLRTKINQQNIMLEAAKATEVDMNVRHAAICKNLASVKIENATLRQILRDLTNKPVNELIEAHRKAVRILQYDEVKEEQSE